MLLLVAPTEHKVRIEVGYGLEGTLTDALSSVIISSAIVPRFKAGDFSGGIERGVDGIISVLSGDTADWQPKVDVRQDDALGRFQQAVPATVLPAGALRLLVSHPQFGRRSRRRRAAPRRRSGLYPLWRWGLGRRSVADLAAALVAAFPAAAVRRAAAARRGAGDAVSRRGLRRGCRRHSQGRTAQPAAKSSACWRIRPPTTATFQFCGRACWRCVTPWPLIYFTPWSVQRIFLLQLVVFLVVGVVLALAPLRFALVPRAVRRARAHRAALEQFVVRGITRTKNRTGVLIFVSLAERYARIIADEGIAAKVHGCGMAGRDRCPDRAYARRPHRRGLSPRPSSAAARCLRRMLRPTARRTNCRTGST